MRPFGACKRTTDNQSIPVLRRIILIFFFSVAVIAAAIGVRFFATGLLVTAPGTRAHSAQLASPSARDLILAPHPGAASIDEQIRALQRRIAVSGSAGELTGRLGALFITKARQTHDPGFYTLADQCALALEASAGESPDALVLRGHVAHAMHRFADAEAIGRRLVKLWPEGWLAHALLGDALMEQGRVDDASASYQQMIDLKPCAQSYSRVAHLRWLRGDLEGALEMMQQSVAAGSPRDPEPLAWAYTRLAAFQLQAADLNGANWSIERALQLVSDYAPALLAKGRLLLAHDEPKAAVAALQGAAKSNPLPEYHWVLAEALHAAGEASEAAQRESILMERGAADDPRTFALFLATLGRDPRRAVDLANAELTQRRDVFTLDVIAWAELSAGNLGVARTQMAAALREGTEEARLFLHAGVIAAACGDQAEAAIYFRKAETLRATLLPSERKLLAHGMTKLAINSTSLDESAAHNLQKITP